MRRLKPTSLLIAAIFFLGMSVMTMMAFEVSSDQSNSEVEYVQFTR